MSLSNLAAMLENWKKHAEEEQSKTSREISFFRQDEVKLKALAEVYKLPIDDVVAGLIHEALLMVEEKMPYVPGDKVIRVEEGANIYEDVGPMADYLKAIERIRESEREEAVD